MPRFFDDDDDENDDDWDEVEDIGSDDDDEPTMPCPYCRREIHEDAQRCPHCERYISAEDSPALAKPWWIIVGVIVSLAAMLWWLL